MFAKNLYKRISILCNIFYKCCTQLIEERKYILITFLFFSIILFWALQDIAIDSWCLTMVKEWNKDNASLTQTIGIEVGVFMATTWYYALNSLDFWNSYIYSTPQNLPILNESSFFLYWGYFILIMAVITIIFGNEKHDRIKVEEHGLTVHELIKTVKWSLRSKQIIFFIFFSLSLKSFSNVNNFVGKIYLIDELKYSQSKYSFISLLGFPVTLLSSILILKLGKTYKALHKFVIIWILRAISDIITINILYCSNLPVLTFDVLLILSNWFNIFTLVTSYTLIINYTSTIANPIIAATQITFVLSLSNFWNDFPKLYTYVIVDIFGIFIPNIIGCTITLFIWAWLYHKTNDPDLYKVMEISSSKKKSD